MTKAKPKALGHDPFQDMDLGWLDEQTDEPAGEPVEEALSDSVEPEPGPDVAPATAGPSTPQATFHFPPDFKWGVATAAHQVEGANAGNDWWAWEQEEGRIKDGRCSDKACDWWENAEADFDRAAGMGMNALRLSVEWSRVEPSPGEFDDDALARYGEMLQGLCERKIEPMVTLHHFTNPLWLVEQGGWENPETIEHFARFVRRVVESLGAHCNLWCTINEPNVYSIQGYVDGVWPPGETNLALAASVTRNLLLGHAAAYQEIHAAQPAARVGLAHNMRIFDPADSHPLFDKLAAWLADKVYNQFMLTALTRGVWMPPLGLGLAWKLRNTLDWIGLNYYTRSLVAFDPAERKTLYCRLLQDPDAEPLDGGYGEFYPHGLFRCLKRLSRLHLPIYITENGIPDDDDDQRPRHLLTHLHEMWHAIQLCYPVMGYYHWTLVDNFEWSEGWSLRFGLLGLDPETQARTPRPSAELYADIIRANAITPGIIAAYAPETLPEFLPR